MKVVNITSRPLDPRKTLRYPLGGYRSRLDGLEDRRLSLLLPGL